MTCSGRPARPAPAKASPSVVAMAAVTLFIAGGARRRRGLRHRWLPLLPAAGGPPAPREVPLRCSSCCRWSPWGVRRGRSAPHSDSLPAVLCSWLVAAGPPSSPPAASARGSRERQPVPPGVSLPSQFPFAAASALEARQAPWGGAEHKSACLSPSCTLLGFLVLSENEDFAAEPLGASAAPPAGTVL